MARHTAYTYYNTGDKLLKKIELYNNNDVAPYKTIEYTYNSANMITAITITNSASLTDTITYTYNTDGSIADVSITHSIPEPVDTSGGDANLQEENNEEVEPNE